MNQYKCPTCESRHNIQDEYETYCKECGTVLQASIQYVAGKKITLDYGLLIKSNL